MFWPLGAILREVHYKIDTSKYYSIILMHLSRVMHLFEDGHEYSKHVGGTRCIEYTFIHLYAFVGFDIISNCSMHGYESLKIEINEVFVLCNCAADGQRYSFTISPTPPTASNCSLTDVFAIRQALVDHTHIFRHYKKNENVTQIQRRLLV